MSANDTDITDGGMVGCPPPFSGAGRSLSVDRWLARAGLQMLGGAPVRVVLWDGEEVAESADPPVARILLRDRTTLLQILLRPDLGFGNAYADGRAEVEGDLVAFLESVYRAAPDAPPAGLLGKCLAQWQSRPRTNTLAGSRDNIHHHYDLGNDFYRLWLDEQMVYTCAYFPTPSASLEEAQVTKMDHVCRKLRLRPGQMVIEAGCGWGALARHMSRHYGVRVRAFNVSREQIAYARERTATEGLSTQVEYLEADYRDISGTCDAFVSVGMLEHVGLAHYRELGTVIRRCLKPLGLGLIHSIGRNTPCATNAWLERHIFPGAYMPTLAQMMEVVQPSGFSVLDVENLRLHYARTLGHWLDRFEGVASQVADEFGERFVRTWRLYLAASLAGFTSGSMQLFQIVFAHAGNNDIPWTRGHLYAPSEPA
jgi:cyclopropane-fatty-acyl-phospholipid synthase